VTSPIEVWPVSVMRAWTTAIYQSPDSRFTLPSVACSDESLKIRVSPYA